MKTRLTIFILFCGTGLYAQTNADYKTLSKACELWGLIKYFHPARPGNDFDSAFATAVPKMLEARNEKEWTDVLTKWLSVLNDPNTRVISADGATTVKGVHKSGFTSDSILVVKISGTELYEDYYEGYRFFQTLLQQLKESRKGIIFDLRQESPIPSQFDGYLSYYYQEVNSALSAEYVPQFKTIYYSGFKPETGGSSGGYTISDVLQNGLLPGNFSEKNQKVVWIINDYSQLPVVALSEQASGAGAILSSSENLADLISPSGTFTFSDHLNVKFKTTEVVFLDGFLPTVNYKYGASEDPVEISKKLLANWKSLKRSESKHSMKVSSDNIASYPKETYPSVGYRILAAAKIFSVIEMFFPYYQFMDKNWRTVLVESLPGFINAKDEIEYGLAVARMYANINDSHGFITGSKAINQLWGEAFPPVFVGWIENRIVITHFLNDSICRVNGINIGDIIVKVNGVPVDELMKKYEIYFAHSTKEPLWQRAAQFCTRGADNQEAAFTIQDKTGKSRDVKMKWSKSYEENFTIKHKLDTIVLLNKNIGYADLTRMEPRQTDQMFETFKDTKAIIFDMRGYPNGTAWSIAPRLTEKKNVGLALFRKPEILSPNISGGDIISNRSYTEFIQTVATSDKWKYKGKTVMLINQNAVSQSEHTGLFFESVNNTTFIGSPTVGANGDVTRFQIPGGMSLAFSGQGVWHVDGKQLQRVGLQPHVLVRPTIKGIRIEKDEVLDKAIDWINKNVK